MKIDAKIRYEEKYLPSKRHRKFRVREVEDAVAVELREVKKENAPVAMVVTDYQSYLDGNGDRQFGLRDTAFLAIDAQLYSEKRDMHGTLDRGVYSVDEFLDDLDRSGDCRRASPPERSKENILKKLGEFLDSHVLINGVIYEQVNEPRYVVMTFGLGHNHGGTALMIHDAYNGNISKDRYFSALQRDEAIDYANKVAAARGDTKNIGTFGDINIQVYMPEMVRCNPQMEHGDGCPFMNSLESMIQGSESVMEAGLLAMVATNAEIHKDDSKGSLEELISSAEGQKKEPAGKSAERDFGER